MTESGGLEHFLCFPNSHRPSLRYRAFIKISRSFSDRSPHYDAQSVYFLISNMTRVEFWFTHPVFGELAGVVFPEYGRGDFLRDAAGRRPEVEVGLQSK